MPRSSSTLFTKGLVLLAVPLLFELLIVSSLLLLQFRYEKTLEEITHRKLAISYAGETWRLTFAYFTNRASNSLQLKEGRGDVDFNERKLQLDQLIRTLQALSPELDMQHYIEMVQAGVKDILDISDRLQVRFSSESLQLDSDNLVVIRDASIKSLQLSDKVRQYREAQLARASKAVQDQKNIRLLIDITVLAAFVGSIIIAAILLRFFISSVLVGFRTLVSNMESFAQGRETQIQPKGSDEIALLNKMFLQMSNELAESRRMKQAYISLLGRDLESPLLSTRNFLSELANSKDGTYTSKAIDGAAKAERNLDRLLKLISELLDIDKRNAKAPLQLTKSPSVSLSSVLQRSAEAVSEFALRANVSLELKECDLKAELDEDRIIQVLVNLLSNAIKFSPANSKVTLSAEKSGDSILIKVIDRGRGVPEKMRDTIFERFTQVDLADATEKGGTGLGLPICKEIVELHGGTIGVDSIDGSGSTFWLRLPQNGGTKSS